jgi:predicted nucleic acid-binding protein
LMAPDINVLLAAFRADHPHPSKAHAWLAGTLAARAEGEALELLPMVTSGFLRLATISGIAWFPATARRTGPPR